MIILHNNKNKIYLVCFFSILTLFGIIFAWQKFSVSSQASTAPEIKKENTNETSLLQDVQNGLELGKLQWDNLQAQLIKSHKQQKLLEAAKEYLNNKSSTTPTSTTSSSSAATTSIK